MQNVAGYQIPYLYLCALMLVGCPLRQSARLAVCTVSEAVASVQQSLCAVVQEAAASSSTYAAEKASQEKHILALQVKSSPSCCVSLHMLQSCCRSVRTLCRIGLEAVEVHTKCCVEEVCSNPQQDE